MEEVVGREQAAQDLPATSQDDEQNLTLSYDELQDLFLSITLEFDQHDENVRDAQLRMWVRNDLFIKGVQDIYFSEVSHDYRSLRDVEIDEDYDPDLENKVVNLLRPYRESIVAALSVGLPVTRFYPEDADNADDILAAQTWTKAADLIRRKNKAKFLFIKALSYQWTHGFVAAYNYAETDEKYGVTQVPKVKDTMMYENTAYCPDCGGALAQSQTEMPLDEADAPQLPCPDCGANVQTLTESIPKHAQVPDGFDSIPKTRECLKIYNGKSVAVAPWAHEVSETPYLILNEDFHIAYLKSIYQDYADKIQPGGDRILYDRWARLGFRYTNDNSRDIQTRRMVWLQPHAYNVLHDDDAQMLTGLYPDGVRITFVGDILVDIREEKMLDHWTIAQDPQEEYVHGEPPINGCIPIQEMTTEQVQITLETMRYSITETFVESSLIDWKKYKNEEIRPGTMTPVKLPIGGNLGNSFFSTKPATLSQEVNLFGKQLIEYGQFESGALPSIYGGQIATGSDTAAEYSMSRAQAMQRLQLLYQTMSFFWSELEGKCVKDFLNNLQHDQKDVVAQGKSGFISVWIKKAEFTGAIGTIEPENSEQFPVSWAQKRDALYQLITLNNEFINQALFHPENRSYVAETIGLPELFIPGEEDRIKQLYEILELVQSQPLDAQGQFASIPPDDEDDDEVHVGVCKAWLVGPVGLYVKQDNPAGYANVVAHMKMHMFKLAQQAAMQQQQERDQQNQDKNKDKNNSNSNAGGDSAIPEP